MILLLGPEGWVFRMRDLLRHSDANIVTARTASRMRGTREHIEVIIEAETKRNPTGDDINAYTLAAMLNTTLGERLEHNQLQTRTIRSGVRIDDEMLVREDRGEFQGFLRKYVASEAGYMLTTAILDTGIDQNSPLWLRFSGSERSAIRYQTQLSMDLTYTPGNIPEPHRPSVRPHSADPDHWGDLRQQGELPMLRPALTEANETDSI